MIISELQAALLIVLAVLVLLVIGLAVRLAATRRRTAQLESALTALRTDLEAVGHGSLAALERLDRLEPVAEQLAERLGTVESSTQARPYEQAIDAVRRGAGRDELLRRFALTPAEADLIVAVHRPARR